MQDRPQAPLSSGARFSVGFLGGVPPALGGGGLEIQMERTAAALERLGHGVARAECADAEVGLDVLHGFHAEPRLWSLLPHWTRNRCPLVVSPVLPVHPREARLLAISARVPGLVTTARMRRDVLRAADAVVALTEYERRLVVRVFGGDPSRTVVVGNGVDPFDDAGLPAPVGLPADEFLLMVGNVSPRKRQAEVARAVQGELPVVVAGEVLGEDEARTSLEQELERAGAIRLGAVGDPKAVRALQRQAAALVLLSSGEAQSLALLEALAAGTPVIASDIPAHRELQAGYPGWVWLVSEPSEVLSAYRALRSATTSSEAPRVPTWDDVAARLAEVYASVSRSSAAARRLPSTPQS